MEIFQIFLPAGHAHVRPKVGLLEQLPNEAYSSEPNLTMKRLEHAGTAMNGTASSDKETRLFVPRLDIGRQEQLQ
jgi:hypothetical protein